MLKNCIRILYYSEFEDNVKSLEKGLDIVGTESEKIPLIDGHFPTENELEGESRLSVLFTSNEHLSLVELSALKPRLHASSEHPICVAVIPVEENVPQLLQERFEVLQEDSSEEIRRDVMQFYKRQIYFEPGYRTFIGRNKELDLFENIQYSAKADYCKAVFISGRPGTGRNAFARECIRRTNIRKQVYEPYCLALGEKDNIENFIVLLNQMRGGAYNQKDLLNYLSRNTEDKTDFAVNLLNSLLGKTEFLIIYDDGACIRKDRKVSEWFLSILNRPSFESNLKLFVITDVINYRNNNPTEEPYASINLYALSLTDRKKLIYLYTGRFISLEEGDVDYLARELSYSPSQIILALDEVIRRGSVKPVISNIDTYRQMGDGKVLSLLKRFEDNEQMRDVFVFIARLEYSSRRILDKVFGRDDEDVKQTIRLLEKQGSLERFGETGEFFHLDGYVCNYIRRNKISYIDKSLESHIKEVLDDYSSSDSDIIKDYPNYLYGAKTSIKNNPSFISSQDVFLPSVVISAIIEEYDQKNWKGVINIAERIVDEKLPYFPEVFRTIRYWYCLALAREQDKEKQKFFEQIELFRNDVDYHFLKGFFYRMNSSFIEAEEEYRRVLRINPHMQRARRELVTVMLAMHKYSDALDLAESNYENDPENPYHVNAFFRCLLRKAGRNREDDQKLQILLDIARNNPAFGDAYKAGMQFEYDRFVMKKSPGELTETVGRLRKRFKNIKYIDSITNDYMSYQEMEPRMKPIAYDSVSE